MTGTQLLDAAIGVVFVILSFSLIASALSEALATALNWRGHMLRRGLLRLLEGAAGAELADGTLPDAGRLGAARLTRALLADPAIRVLHGPRGILAILWDRLAGWRQSPDARTAARIGRLPSAIPASSFARALVDTLARQIDLSMVEPEQSLSDAAGLAAFTGRLEAEAIRILRGPDGALTRLSLAPELKARLRDGVGRLSAVRELRARLEGGRGGVEAGPNIESAARVPVDIKAEVEAEVAAEIIRLARQAEAGLLGVLQDLAGWFDRAMERVSGWYMRRSRLALFVLGVLLAASVNANLAGLGGGILRDDRLRGALVDLAQDRAETGLPRGRPAAGPETVEDLAERIDAAHESLRALPGRAGDGFGPGFGWSCGVNESWPACAVRTTRPSAVISWLLIGLGCMMGGQFWYDLLGAVLRFRPASDAARQRG